MHPYTPRFGPFFQPPNRDDVTIGVLSRLVSALDRAASAGALPRRLPVYVSEFGVQSYPGPAVRRAAADAVGLPLDRREDGLEQRAREVVLAVPAARRPARRPARTASSSRACSFTRRASRSRPTTASACRSSSRRSRARRVALWGLVRPAHGARRLARDPGQGPPRRLEEARDAALRRQRLLAARRGGEGRAPVARRVDRSGDRHAVGRLGDGRAVGAAAVAAVTCGAACGAARDRRTLTLAAIGTAGGLFSGLFGVGGGAVMVPLLLLWLGYEERSAPPRRSARSRSSSAFAAAAQGDLRQRRRRRRAARRDPRGRRRAARHVAAAARAGRRDRVRVRAAAGGRRDPAGGVVVILAALIGVLAGIASGLLGIGGGHPVRAGADDPARARPGRGGGDVAAGDRAGRARRQLAPAQLRQPADSRCRRDGRVVDRGRARRRRARERAARAGRCGSASRCCC